MKVTDLKENECIHCETEEQAKAICKLMHKAGLKWNSGDSYLSKNHYHICKSETCYYPKNGSYSVLHYAKEENYKIYKAEQFLTQETETMQTKITLANQSQEINIIPQEGFEIDLENSDLKNGKVVFKEVEKKYPNRFRVPKIINVEEVILSEIYARKLDILDILLCLRDEYNRIDGFKEGFRFVEGMYCIENFDGKLTLDSSCYSNKIMHFGKEETAKLFLNNFEEQLETVKEFL